MQPAQCVQSLPGAYCLEVAGGLSFDRALTRPELFWGHIASNPALHRNLPFFMQAHGNAGESTGTSKLFVSSGSNDDPVFRKPALEWIRYWSRADDKPWDLATVTLDGHSHMSAPPAAFRDGLAWLFSDE